MSTNNFTTFDSGTGKGKKTVNLLPGLLSAVGLNDNKKPALIISYCDGHASCQTAMQTNGVAVVPLTSDAAAYSNFNLASVLDYVVNILRVRDIIVNAANLPVNGVINFERYLYEIAANPVIKKLWEKGEEMFVHGYLNQNKITTLSSVNNIETSTAS
ncbi:MAG: hypothetical protein ACOVRN_15450 [Flavobacterium sp.]